VIQLPPAPTEAVLIINIRFWIYTGTDWVRLSFFLKNRTAYYAVLFFLKNRTAYYPVLFLSKNTVTPLNLNKSIMTLKFSNKITMNMKITNRNYNYSNNYDILIVSDYISVYADHAMDKQISSADWLYLLQLVQYCWYLCPYFWLESDNCAYWLNCAHNFAKWRPIINTLTVTHCSTFVLTILPHTKGVTTLPCEIYGNFLTHNGPVFLRDRVYLADLSVARSPCNSPVSPDHSLTVKSQPTETMSLPRASDTQPFTRRWWPCNTATLRSHNYQLQVNNINTTT